MIKYFYYFITLNPQLGVSVSIHITSQDSDQIGKKSLKSLIWYCKFYEIIIVGFAVYIICIRH
jgi:hypothetical protein